MKTRISKICVSVVVSLIVLIVGFVWKNTGLNKTVVEVKADDSPTQVTVSNTGPDFKSGEDVYESPVSTTASPTDEGTSTLAIKATSEDPNDDDYFLIVCTTSSVAPEGGAGNAPSCDDTQLCISSSTTDETEATCTVNTTGLSSETYAWYAFVCDDVSGSACSSSSQGTLSDGSESPLKVNHYPTFGGINDTSANPGGTVTFTTTSEDPDSDGGDDTITLVVCKTAGVSGTDCDGGAGDRYCVSSGTHTSNATCDYSVPSVQPDGDFNYYGYVFDEHDLQSTSSQSGSFTINNVSPVVTAGTINAGSDITLTEDTTTSVVLTVDVTDSNSCNDLDVEGFLYRSGVGYTTSCDDSGDADDDSCYPEITCSDGGTCTGDTDNAASYTCTVSVEYHADPTDTSTEYPTEDWGSTLNANDAVYGTGGDNVDAVSSNVEMLSLEALRINDGVSTTINYGSMNPGENSDTTNQQTTINATGNVGLDTDLSGTNMTYSSYTIPVANQKYSSSAFDYDLAGTALSASATELELNVPKTIDTGSTVVGQAIIYWGIEIPLVAGSGTYNGTNTIGAVKGETGDW